MILIQQVPTWIRSMMGGPPRMPTLTEGSHYDLKDFYEKVNIEYFSGRLNLEITWFGNRHRVARSCRTLGLYSRHEKLIKIHQILDDEKFPEFFVSYVVFHEMLHHVCPPKRGRNGRRDIHHKEFKEREKKFLHYDLARKWEKENLSSILNLRETYGRAQQVG